MIRQEDGVELRIMENIRMGLYDMNIYYRWLNVCRIWSGNPLVLS